MKNSGFEQPVAIQIKKNGAGAYQTNIDNLRVVHVIESQTNIMSETIESVANTGLENDRMSCMTELENINPVRMTESENTVINHTEQNQNNLAEFPKANLKPKNAKNGREILKSIKIPFLYYILYFLVYSASFFWNVSYQPPKSITINEGLIETNYIRLMPPSIKIYDLVRFLITSFAPLISLCLFSTLYFTVKKFEILKRFVCWLFFISMMAILLVNPFTSLSTVFGLVETYKIVLIVLSLLFALEMLFVFLINRRTFYINPVIFTVTMTFALFFLTNYIKIHTKKIVSEPIFEEVVRSSEYKVSSVVFPDISADAAFAIFEICKKYDFPVHNVEVETGEYANGFVSFNYGMKKYSKLFIGANVLNNLSIDEMKATMEHEMNLFNFINFGVEIILLSITVFVFFHFIRRRILSNSKNYTMRKVALSVMTLFLFLKMIDLCNYLSSILISYHADSKITECDGMIRFLANVLGYNGYSESDTSSVYDFKAYNPYSLYHTIPSMLGRIFKVLKRCPGSFNYVVKYKLQQ